MPARPYRIPAPSQNMKEESYIGNAATKNPIELSDMNKTRQETQRLALRDTHGTTIQKFHIYLSKLVRGDNKKINIFNLY